jgi:hypothetical protein
MQRVERQTTLAQGVLLVVGAVLFLSEGFGVASVAGADPSTLGIALYAVGFGLAAAGSAFAGKRIQTALQGTAALGFAVIAVGTVASLGIAASVLGVALVVLPVIAQIYLQRSAGSSAEGDGSRSSGN